MRIAVLFLCSAATFGAISIRSSAAPTRPGAIKIAVFGFELDDQTPAAAYVGKPAPKNDSSRTDLQMVTKAAREELAGSGHYTIVSVDGADAKPVKDHTLRDCGGCEAAIARKLGAQQSMIGIVRRVTQTDYYILLVIRDAKTGKVLDSQAANFAGGDEGWASGARVLIMYQVLPR
ncbi:MAG: DUF3280 domain-containing protein [Steroidobacteraceae bacterium]